MSGVSLCPLNSLPTEFRSAERRSQERAAAHGRGDMDAPIATRNLYQESRKTQNFKNDVTELEVLLGRGSSRDDDLLVAGNLAHINQPDDNGVTPLHTGCAISRTLTR